MALGNENNLLRLNENEFCFCLELSENSRENNGKSNMGASWIDSGKDIIIVLD